MLPLTKKVNSCFLSYKSQLDKTRLVVLLQDIKHKATLPQKNLYSFTSDWYKALILETPLINSISFNPEEQLAIRTSLYLSHIIKQWIYFLRIFQLGVRVQAQPQYGASGPHRGLRALLKVPTVAFDIAGA